MEGPRWRRHGRCRQTCSLPSQCLLARLQLHLSVPKPIVLSFRKAVAGRDAASSQKQNHPKILLDVFVGHVAVGLGIRSVSDLLLVSHPSTRFGVLREHGSDGGERLRKGRVCDAFGLPCKMIVHDFLFPLPSQVSPKPCPVFQVAVPSRYSLSAHLPKDGVTSMQVSSRHIRAGNHDWVVYNISTTAFPML